MIAVINDHSSGGGGDEEDDKDYNGDSDVRYDDLPF